MQGAVRQRWDAVREFIVKLIQQVTSYITCFPTLQPCPFKFITLTKVLLLITFFLPSLIFCSRFFSSFLLDLKYSSLSFLTSLCFHFIIVFYVHVTDVGFFLLKGLCFSFLSFLSYLNFLSSLCYQFPHFCLLF